MRRTLIALLFFPTLAFAYSCENFVADYDLAANHMNVEAQKRVLMNAHGLFRDPVISEAMSKATIAYYGPEVSEPQVQSFSNLVVASTYYECKSNSEQTLRRALVTGLKSL